MFLSDIAAAGGKKVDSYYVCKDWTLSHEGTTGKRLSDLVFGRKYPTKEGWGVWKRELTRLHSEYWALPMPLDRWKHWSHRRWKYWMNDEKDEQTRPTNQGVEVYDRVPGDRRQYYRKRDGVL